MINSTSSPGFDNTSVEHVDITIVGGGMVGLLAAVALQQDYKIALVDPAYSAISGYQKTDFSTAISEQKTTRISAINPASQAFFAALGVWDAIQPAAHPYGAMSIKDMSGKGVLDIDGQSLQQYPLGWMTENEAIVSSLQQSINPRQCEIIQSAFDPAINKASDLAEGLLYLQQGSSADPASNRAIQSSLIIAADGAQSGIRNLLEIPHASHKYDHHGVVATIRHSSDNQGVARQWFIGRDILAFLPVDKHHCSIVWSTTDPVGIRSLSDTNFCEYLTEYSQSEVGVIEGSSARLAFPLAYGRSKHYHQQNVVLVGDAAHQVHPLAGLGANLGFMDIIALTRALENGIKPSSLQKYERHRQTHALMAQQGIDWIYKSFQVQQSPLTALRGTVINIANKSSLFKKQMAKLASGFDDFTDFTS